MSSTTTTTTTTTSCLEQMREQFLQKIQREQQLKFKQQQQQQLASKPPTVATRTRLTPSRSIQNIPVYTKNNLGYRNDHHQHQPIEQRKSVGSVEPSMSRGQQQQHAGSRLGRVASVNVGVSYKYNNNTNGYNNNNNNTSRNRSSLSRIHSLGNVSQQHSGRAGGVIGGITSVNITSTPWAYANTQPEWCSTNTNNCVSSTSRPHLLGELQQQQQHRQQPQQHQLSKQTNKVNNTQVDNSRRQPLERPAAAAVVSTTTTKPTAKRTVSLAGRAAAMAAAGFECHICQRTFAAPERLERHVSVCGKTFAKQRPVFNSAKQRHGGGGGQGDQDKGVGREAGGDETHSKDGEVMNRDKPNWKESRQKFLQALREAKRKAVATEVKVVTKDNVVDHDQEKENGDEQLSELDSGAQPLVNCSYCRRTFSELVILKHETICGRLYRKKNFNVIS